MSFKATLRTLHEIVQGQALSLAGETPAPYFQVHGFDT